MFARRTATKIKNGKVSREDCPHGEKFANYVEVDLEKKLWNKYFEYFPY